MADASSRRDFLKVSALGLGAMGAHPSALAANAWPLPANSQASDISIWVTGGEKRFASGTPIHWQEAVKRNTGEVVEVDPAKRHQEILGFGAAFTDSSCYMFNQLAGPTRDALFHELFRPSEMGLNVCRTCIGSSDCSASPYTYDSGSEDRQLARFAIDHDREYILPMLRQARQVNPDLFLFSSPWSPPGWMKWNLSLLGGSMNRNYLPDYARYLVKFLQAYESEGVPVQAITTQNEVDTDQHGQMPACVWAQEAEVEFVGDYLGPMLEKEKLATKIWLVDHNYSLWGRAVCELQDRDVRRYANGIAWHCYSGTADMIDQVHDAFPDAAMHFTEGGGLITDRDHMEDWAKWAAVFGAALRHWCRSVTAWNLALDENGGPKIGPYPCCPLVTVDSRTRELGRTGLYWALSHYARKIRRGAVRIGSHTQARDLEHVAVQNPDGERILVLANSGAERNVQVRQGESSATVVLPQNSVATLAWK